MQEKNYKQISHKYRKGDYVTLKKLGILRQLALPREGPSYKVMIMKHNNNGSILIEKAPTNIKNVNIRRVKSCSILLQD